ncbi:unnamed protein product [Lupinus luteus]|uniref:18S rRNA (guanine(1575)-N(7))-methyltransferase Bud23 C-terminal domain-containing protein n=1 Tax=Lupinus luteus TaxID=3873 RepID=A0AAV1Y8P0_LUPLU
MLVYPENIDQRDLILNAAMPAGFAGGIVVDFPHSSKKRKEFLVLTCGQRSMNASMPKGKDEDDESCSDDSIEDEENQTVCISDRHRPRKKVKANKNGKGREWIMRKKRTLVGNERTAFGLICAVCLSAVHICCHLYLWALQSASSLGPLDAVRNLHLRIFL